MYFYYDLLSERDMYNRRMEEVETEIDQQLMIAERKAREEVLFSLKAHRAEIVN